MKGNFRYILEPYKQGKKYTCPSCGHNKKFVRYIDTITGDQVADHVGVCERKDNCSYQYTPAQYFKDNGINRTFEPEAKFVAPAPKPVSYIDIELVNKSLKGYESNNFAQFLINHFGAETANQLFETYILGTSKCWQGATIYWQVDINSKCRTGKIINYNPTTGKRIRKEVDLITWVHSVLKLKDYNLEQCYFGSHLLKFDNRPIALFESEKTAIIASVYFPKFVCLATGGAEGINEAKSQILNILNRPVILFPDLSQPKEGKASTFEKWQEKAKKYFTCKYIFSDLLEKNATETDKINGLDICDYLLKLEPPKPIIDYSKSWQYIWEQYDCTNWSNEAKQDLEAKQLKLLSDYSKMLHKF